MEDCNFMSNCVRCLHMHYGHFLALEQSGVDVRNVVGEWVAHWLQADIDSSAKAPKREERPCATAHLISNV